MENVAVGCIQPRTRIFETHEEFDGLVRRFLRQPQAKSAQVLVFPELMGVMLAPPLISGLKLGFIKRADQGRQRGAGFFSRRVGRVADATAGALGGGLSGSLKRLLSKNSAALLDAYIETFGSLAREYGTIMVAGSLYTFDEESQSLRNRAYVFKANGEVIGYQDKLNLAPAEAQLADPGTELKVFDTWFGRMAVLIGRDVLYPELARYLAVQGVDLIAGIAAAPGTAQASITRSALALRAEENQVYTAASFLLGPNFLDRENREDYCGQSALLAPISLSAKGDGVLSQTASNRTEAVTAADLDNQAMDSLRQTSRFRPRQDMNLGSTGLALAEMYRGGLSIKEAAERRIGWPAEPAPEALPFEAVLPDEQWPEPPRLVVESEPDFEFPATGEPEAEVEEVAQAETEPDVEAEPGAAAAEEVETEAKEESLSYSVPDALSLSGHGWQEDEE